MACKFMDYDADMEVLKKIGVNIFIKLYGGKEKDSLKSLRWFTIII